MDSDGPACLSVSSAAEALKHIAAGQHRRATGCAQMCVCVRARVCVIVCDSRAALTVAHTGARTNTHCMQLGRPVPCRYTRENAESSRSHCVVSVYVESVGRAAQGRTDVAGRLHLVDLAGSVRTSRPAIPT